LEAGLGQLNHYRHYTATTVKLVLVVLLVLVLGAMPISPPFVYRSLPKLHWVIYRNWPKSNFGTPRIIITSERIQLSVTSIVAEQTIRSSGIPRICWGRGVNRRCPYMLAHSIKNPLLLASSQTKRPDQTCETTGSSYWRLAAM